MTPLAIAFSFLALSITLLLIDLILPSAGVLLALAILCGIAADVFAFRAGTKAGIWMLIGELALVPLGAYLFVKWWHLTPFGKRMIIPIPQSKPFTWESDKLVGKEGIAMEDFLPTGRIMIDGKLFDAMSSKATILKDQRVVVVLEEMGQLFVTPKEIDSPIDPLDLKNITSEQRAVTDRMNLPAQDLGIQSLDS